MVLIMIQNYPETSSLSQTNLLIEKNSNLSDMPSAKAKKIADLFIATLSQEETSPIKTNDTEQPLLSETDRINIKQILTPDLVQKLKNGFDLKEIPPFSLLGHGKHNTVWTHPQYPHVVFKFMQQDEAEKQELVAKKTR